MRDGNDQLVNPFSENFSATWSEYMQFRLDQHRFSYKTAAAEQKAIDHLFQLAGGDEGKARKIIDQTIANGWKGLFPVKSNEKGLRIDTGADKTASDFLSQWNNQAKTA